jgi:hypothetical protein
MPLSVMPIPNIVTITALPLGGVLPIEQHGVLLVVAQPVEERSRRLDDRRRRVIRCAGLRFGCCRVFLGTAKVDQSAGRRHSGAEGGTAADEGPPVESTGRGWWRLGLDVRVIQNVFHRHVMHDF